MRNIRILAGSIVAAATICMATGSPAGAVTSKECSAKYKAAKQDGSLAAGEKYKTFRTTECASGSASTSSAAAPAATPAAASTSAAAKPSAPAAVSGAAAGSGSATFPSAVDPKYSKLTAGKARMQTCLDQYKVNKSSSANGGMRWIQKGGGYYSECSKKLKGA